MDNQFKSNPQKPSDFFADGSYNRTPVKGTVARGFIPYEFNGQTADKVLGVVNPTIPSEANLKLGQKKYLTFCSPCHGNYGDGDSRLRGQFPNPPSLHTTKLREWEDGQIYHVITAGQNTMPSYAAMVTREERWAIVNYIRVLQKAKNATQADVDEVRKEMASNGK
jgi:mono/diheme cytochrome c family protein